MHLHFLLMLCIGKYTVVAIYADGLTHGKYTLIILNFLMKQL